MNPKLRNYLVEKARTNSALPITYTKVCDECDIDIKNPEDPTDKSELERLLSEVAQYELKNSRPDISSITRADELSHYDQVQVHACTSFWSDENNYKAFSLG